MNEAWFRIDPTTKVITLAVHVQPNARRSEVIGPHGGALKIRIAAPAVDGKANTALLAFIADAFAVPRKQVTLVRGESSRHKIVEVRGSQVFPANVIATAAAHQGRYGRG